MHVDTPTRRTDGNSSGWRLWFGFAGAAAAWVAHGFFSVVLSAQACEDGGGSWGVLPAAGVRLALAALTLALFGIALYAGVVSLGNWRRLSHDRQILHAEASGREQFLALGGILVSSIFVVGIFWGGLPLILLDVCNKGR